MTWNRADIQVDALGRQMLSARAGFEDELPSGNIATDFHGFTHSGGQGVSALQPVGQDRRPFDKIAAGTDCFIYELVKQAHVP